VVSQPPGNLERSYKQCTLTCTCHAAQERIASQAVVVGGHLWLIAGWDPGHKRDGGEILSDLWRLDLSSYEWEQMTPKASAGFSLPVECLDTSRTVSLSNQ
jgi:hypothetical protein